LQKTTGKTIEQLKKMGTDGKLSFEMTRKALKQATQQSGMYYQATEKLSQSLNGLFSTLKDSINLAFAELGTEIVKVVDLKNIIKDIVDYAERITQSFKELSPEMKKFIVYGGMFLTALLPIGLALGGFLVALKQIAIVIAFIGRTALLNPFTFWLSAIALLVTNFDTIWSIVKKIFDIIGKITIGAVRMFGRDTAFGKFVNSKLDLFIGKEQNQTTIPIPAQSPQSFSGGFDVNFANMPKNTTVLQRQSTPNFDLGFNTTYAPR
jgi:hypothetical protein